MTCDLTSPPSIPETVPERQRRPSELERAAAMEAELREAARKKSREAALSATTDIFAEHFDSPGAGDQAVTHFTDNPHLRDNWDDAEGYYRVRIGELLDGR